MRRTKRRGFSPFLVGAVVLILVGVGTYFGFTKANPFASPKTLTAAFRSSGDVKSNSPVRVAGVQIGKVTEVEPLEKDGSGSGTKVTMELTDDAPPIKTDTKIKIRPRIFLEGNYFVDVRPGSPSAPEMEEDDVVPTTQTAFPVQIGQVLSTLQSDTREDLRKVLQELGSGFSKGGARGFNRAITYWEPAFKNTAIANQATLGLLEHDLSNYIRHAATVAQALDRNEVALKDLITNLADTAQAFAVEGDNLSATIRQLPPTLRVGQQALGALNEAFPAVRRFVADARPTVREAGPTLREQLPFLREARRLVSGPELKGLVKDLRPTVPNLVELNKGGVPLQKQLRLLSSCQNEVVLPTAEDRIDDPNFPSTGRVFEEGVKWLPGIAGESRNFDANGQWVRSQAATANFAYAAGAGKFFLTERPIQGVNPPKAAGPPPLRADVPCETQQPPDLRTRVGAAPRAIEVNQDAPGADERRDKLLGEAVRLLRDDIDRLGLDLKVSGKPLSAGDLGGLAASIPRGGGG